MTELGIFYHATPVENLNSILMSGITTSQDGMVHLTRDEVAAVKYCASRGLRKIATLRIRLDDLSKVADILDSGCDLYNCSCYGYEDDIPRERIIDVSIWDTTKTPLV